MGYKFNWSIALVVSLMLAACAPVAPLATAQPTDASVHLKVNVQPYMGYAPLLIAKEEGYFAKYGIEAEFVEAASADALPLVMQGQLDMSVAVMSAGLFNAIGRGGTGRLVMGLSQWNAGDCTSTAIVGRKAQVAQLKNIAAWKGLTISTNETGLQGTQGFFADQVLAKGGLTVKDVQVTKLPAPAAMDALQSGATPLAMLTEPWVTYAVSTGRGEILYGGQDIVPGAQLSALVFGEGLLKSPDLGLRAAQAYLEGARQYQRGATERNVEILAQYTKMEKDVLTQMCWTSIPADGNLNIDNIVAFQKWAVTQGQLDQVVAPDKFWDSRFTDKLKNTGTK